eukprot:TRINITY_DN26155_c0_g1_i1.p1 TRINITY_DN26155_c0_g1~~TRINITY_DN26155_c0_g1_i1.p1  ORF type:complete len:405 (-),score=68.87 TRINITY_DN26155_c0_g1_i1:35-1120(-)
MTAAPQAMTLPPLFRQVQLRYDEDLQKERASRDVQVRELEAKTRSVRAVAAAEAARRRDEAHFTAVETERSAEDRVQEVERERIRQSEEHRLNLKAIEDAIEANRLEADERLQRIEQETMALHAEGGARVLRVGAEREAAVRVARDRCENANRIGEESARQAQLHEKAILAKSKASIAEEEAKQERRITHANMLCETYLIRLEETTAETLQFVGNRILEVLQEARTSRSLLEENRSRVHEHLQDSVRRNRDELEGVHTAAKQSLQEARASLRQAELFSGYTAAVVDTARENRLRLRREELCRCAEAIERKARIRPHSPVRSLEEIARNLRAGLFREPQPPPPSLPSRGFSMLPPSRTTAES